MERQTRLQDWLTATLPTLSLPADFALAPASSDASFRCYWRVTFPQSPATPSLIVMDAPPSHEDCGPWLKIAELLRQAQVHAPEVLATHLDDGFLLLSDLGNTTYLQALTAQPEQAAPLYAEALGALLAMQLASQPDVLPEYSREKLRQEMELFPEWFVQRHKGVTLSDKERKQLDQVFEQILDMNCAEPKVYVHRDFHSRNLMLLPGTGTPGVIDFQDAVYGPLSYDLVSLFKDAYIEWDEEQTIDWLVRYWQTARQLGLPVREHFADFYREYEWMGVQRHLKVLGIFARLYHRDGKDGYLKDLPLVMRYLKKACKRYGELAPLYVLLDKLDESEKTTVGYTF